MQAPIQLSCESVDDLQILIKLARTVHSNLRASNPGLPSRTQKNCGPNNSRESEARGLDVTWAGRAWGQGGTHWASAFLLTPRCWSGPLNSETQCNPSWGEPQSEVFKYPPSPWGGGGGKGQGAHSWGSILVKMLTVTLIWLNWHIWTGASMGPGASFGKNRTGDGIQSHGQSENRERNENTRNTRHFIKNQFIITLFVILSIYFNIIFIFILF